MELCLCFNSLSLFDGCCSPSNRAYTLTNKHYCLLFTKSILGLNALSFSLGSICRPTHNKALPILNSYPLSIYKDFATAIANAGVLESLFRDGCDLF